MVYAYSVGKNVSAMLLILSLNRICVFKMMRIQYWNEWAYIQSIKFRTVFYCALIVIGNSVLSCDTSMLLLRRMATRDTL
jgi:hypothetical protein